MDFSPETESELGRLAKEEGRFTEAILHCLTILEKHGEDATTHANLGGIYARMSNQERALFHLERARAIAPHNPRHHDDYLYFLHHSNISEKAHFDEHKAYATLFPQGGIPLPERTRLLGENKIRIGYLSSDVHEHATSFILEAILALHDAARFETYLYSSGSHRDETSFRIASRAHHFKDIQPLSYTERRLEILKDEIDILVDLGGHTGDNNLPVFALRAAPIQLSWFSYMDTSGLETMDYRLTDNLRTPEGREKFYTEKIIRVPDSYCFLPQPKSLPPPNLPPFTRNGFITFGSFSSSHKITSEVLTTWASLLEKIPNSRLVIFIPESHEYKAWLLAEFQKRNIETTRLTPLPYTTLSNFLEVLSHTDIALDPFPYTGGATTYHALSVGVPTLTLMGKKEYERNAAAIVTSVGLTDWIAKSSAEYIQIAVQKSHNPDVLIEMRESLPKKVRESAPQVVRSVEHTFEELVKKHQSTPVSKSANTSPDIHLA